MLIRPAVDADDGAIWRILEPTIRAGETLMLPPQMDQPAAVSYWRQTSHQAFVAQVGADIVGTYYLRANQQGHGSHVANCGYATASWAAGRGIARAMCLHSLAEARALGFVAMQYNCVVASNERAVGLWQSCGFEVVGRVPETFRHPKLGHVDTLVMYRRL
jgi:ribosomal protein S18 acetylase RimI-like enzyme